MIRLARTTALVAVLACLAWTSLAAREVSITILHTCDLHGNVLPAESYEGKTNLGGIARCATVIRRIRAEEKNVLLVDAGDTMQGTPVSFLSDGEVMVKCLNQLHYDSWTWGNHEFDWGLGKLAANAERAEVPIVVANIQEAGSGGTPTSQRITSRLKPYVVREIDGVKVGIIGLDTPDIPSWSRPRLFAGLEFKDSVEALRRTVPEARAAGAQVLVLVCHQGYREAGDDHANQINAIARNFPELDVIIGAHTHRNFPEFKVSNILYSQADYYGIYLGRVDLVFDTEKGRVVKRQSNTLLMDEHIPLDGEVLKLAGAEIDRAEKLSSARLGEATDDLWIRALPHKETPIHNVIFEAIADALGARGVKVDAIVHGINERRNGLKDLRFVKSAEFRGIWGLHWKFDPSAPEGHRTISLTHTNGSPVTDDEKLAVAFNSYDLASGGKRFPRLHTIADRPETHLLETDIMTRQAVIDYIRKKGTITPTIGGWWEVVPKASAAAR